MTILNLMKMADSSENRKKILWKNKKLLITSNISSVFIRLVLQTHKSQGLVWERVNKLKEDGFGKQCGKKIKCWQPAFSTFLTVFSTPSKREIII